ncbi:MAG: CPBP family intramembrane metalloprotease [Elusimicrobia bacterium]|nr:CPBP family intramembrane metalloprotease [Elusimicrobiota bacterium]
MNKLDQPKEFKNSLSLLASFLFIASNFIFGMAVYIFLKITGHLLNFSLDKNYFLFLTEFLTNFVMCAVLLWVSVSRLGITLNPPELKKEIFKGLKLSLPFTLFYFVVLTTLYYLKAPSFGFEIFENSILISILEDIFKKKDLILFLVIFINMCIFTPLKEEILIRRFLYVSLRKKSSFFLSTLLSSLLFCLIHGNLIMAFVYSVIASYLYEKHGDLKINIVMHAIINFLIICIFLAVR